jgi:hypothetical protein
MRTIFKKTSKKLLKTGFFSHFTFSDSAMSFKHSNRVFSLQQIPGQYAYIFSSGYVSEWIETGPTFESDYKSLGPIPRAAFGCDFKQRTNNPDYVLRASLSLIGIGV